MSTGTPATALSRRRDFAPCRTRVLTVRSRSATKHRQSEVPRLIALVTARCTPQPWRPPHRCRPAMSRTPLPLSAFVSTHAAQPTPAVSQSSDERRRSSSGARPATRSRRSSRSVQTAADRRLAPVAFGRWPVADHRLLPGHSAPTGAD